MKLEIVCQDEDIFVINKPPHLLSVPGRGAEKYDSVQSRCAAISPGAVAVHRLDMATSGIMLVAKHKAAERFYKNLFAERQTEKRYIAVVHGEVTHNSGQIDFPLTADWENRPRQKICYQHGKPSLTAFRVLSRKQGRTRLMLMPYTGRSHQLRVHLSGIGHPIVGDEWYAYPQDCAEPRLLLHAGFLALKNRNGIWQSFTVPPGF